MADLPFGDASGIPSGGSSPPRRKSAPRSRRRQGPPAPPGPPNLPLDRLSSVRYPNSMFTTVHPIAKSETTHGKPQHGHGTSASLDGKEGRHSRAIARRHSNPEPKPEEVVVRIDASPINPSDQGLLFGGADMSTAKASGTADSPVVTATISPAVMKGMAGRLDQAMPVGNEGAGVVVQAGASPAAQALLGKTVAIVGGAMYSQYRCVKAVSAWCCRRAPHPPRAPPVSSIRSPRSAWSRPSRGGSQGARAHGRRLQSRADAQQALHQGRRRPRQHRAQARAVDLLKKIGATHVCNSSAPTFMDDLTEALVATAPRRLRRDRRRKLAGQILTCMEIAANKRRRNTAAMVDHAQAGLHLRGLDRGPTNSIAPSAWPGDRRLAAHAFPPEDWTRGNPEAPPACRGGIKTTFASSTRRRSPRRRAAARRDRRIRQASDRREVLITPTRDSAESTAACGPTSSSSSPTTSATQTSATAASRTPCFPELDPSGRRRPALHRRYSNSPVCSPTRFALMTGRFQYR